MFALTSAARRVGYLIALAMFAVAGWPAGALGQLFNFDGGSLTHYKYAAASGGQDVAPRFDQAGVQFDGSVRAPALIGWAMGANPYPEGTVPAGRIGDVNLATGTYSPTLVLMSTSAPGISRVTQGLSWNLRQEVSGSPHTSNGYSGLNWFDMSQPEIVLYDADSDPGTLSYGDILYIIYGADRFLAFMRVGDDAVEFQGINGTGGMVIYQSGSPDTYVYYDEHATTTYFFGFNTASGNADGQLWKVVDPSGAVAYVGSGTASTAASTGYSNKRVRYAYDGADSGHRQIRSSYSSHDGVTRRDSVIIETKTGGTWPGSATGVVEVGRIEYSYYTGDDANGDNGNLKTVTVTTPLSESGVSEVQTWYFRYYSFNGTYDHYDATNNPGYPNALKLVLGPEGVRLHASYASDSDSTLKNDSLAYFTYPSGSDYRVATVFLNGQCGCGGSGSNGLHTLTYEDNTSYSTYIGNSTYDTGFAKRTIVEGPTDWRVCYYDEVAQGLSTVITDSDPAGSPTEMWATEVVRNSNGQVTEIHSPANNTGYTHNSGGNPDGSFTHSSSVGLVTTFERDASGGDAGLVQSIRWKTGNSGTEYYTSVTDHATAVKVFTGATMYATFVADTNPYKTEHSTASLGTGGTDYDQTTFTKTLYGSPYEVALKKMVTTNPTVTTGNNGSNSATTTTRYVRKNGTTAFTQDANGIFTYYKLDDKGQLIELIDDCQTNNGSDFASGDDPNTDFGITETGDGLRIITTYTYDAQGRLDETTLPSGRVTKNIYTKLSDGRLVTIGVPRYVSGSSTAYGPLSYTITNLAGRVEFQATLAVGSVNLGSIPFDDWVDETTGDEFSALHSTLQGTSRANFQNATMNVYADGGTQLTESRMYFNIPTSGYGSAGSEYDATTYVYDDMGRRIRTVVPDGTISRVTFDTPGRAIESSTGTDDTGLPGSPMAGTSNMVTTSKTEYDGGSDGGNSYVTARSTDADGNWGTAGDTRTISYTNDVRGRAILVTNPLSPHVFNKYDNRGRLVASGLFSSTGSIVVGTDDPTTETANRLALTQTFYDERGQVWKSQRHKIDASDGSDDDNLQTLTWYDANGRAIKRKGETYEKYLLDRLGRVTNTYVLASDNDSTYSNALDVTGDYVLEERQTYYKDSSVNGAGQPLLSVVVDRFHDDASGTGAQDTDSDNSLVDFAGGKIKGRAQITAMAYDAWDRLEETVAYGTNGGSNLDWDSLSFPVTRSDTELVTSNTYDDAGRVQDVTDPRGIVTRTQYDRAGRRIATINNYVNGTPSGPTATDDLFTRFAYSNGHLIDMWTDIQGNDGDGVVPLGGNRSSPADDDDQVTVYTYGVPKGASAGDSNIASNSLLYKVAYPDSSSGTDLVTFAYNAQGQEIWKKDQMGNVIETAYNLLGQVTHKEATTIQTGSPYFVDAGVQRISTEYDSSARVEYVTQYDNPTPGSGADVNGVKYTYGEWGEVTKLEQDPDSKVGGGGSAAFAVSYAYSKATGGRNTLRRTSITYPSGTVYNYDFGSGINDNASRVYQIKNGAGTALATYWYNGIDQVIKTKEDVPKIYHDLDGSSAETYTDLDRFNRITGDAWTKEYSGGSVDFHADTITYDRDSGITSITDTIQKNSGGSRVFDMKCTNDELGRLADAKLGSYSGGTISGATREEAWTLDQLGNFARYQYDATGNGSFGDAGDIDDTRTHNLANELTTRDTNSDSSVDYTLTYDDDGNMTSDGQNYKNYFNAFGQLVKVTTLGGSTVAEYVYNPLGWLSSFHEDADGDGDTDASDSKVFEVYDGWRPIGLYRDGDGVTTKPKEEYCNHNAGLGGYGGASGGVGGNIDNVIARAKDNSSPWNSASDGVLEDVVHYAQDYHGNVVAVLTDSGKMVESVTFSPYGTAAASPAGDTDANFTMDSTDETAITSGSYDVRKDVDLDGDHDAADVTQAKSYASGYQTLGIGKLSSTAVMNRKGYAGAECDRRTPDFISMRHRYFVPSLGRWVSRDPAGYHDGSNLYEYVQDGPMLGLDPSGLATGDGGGGCGAGLACGTGSTTWAPPPLPLPRPRRGTCFRQLRNILANIPQIRDLWTSLSSSCAVTISCCSNSAAPCNTGACGVSTLGPGAGPPVTICICMDPAGNPVCPDMVSTISHELIHAWQACNRATGPFAPSPPTPGICDNAFLCDEIGAYYNELHSTCRNPATCCPFLCSSYSNFGCPSASLCLAKCQVMWNRCIRSPF